jgi:hypothetical protein
MIRENILQLSLIILLANRYLLRLTEALHRKGGKIWLTTTTYIKILKLLRKHYEDNCFNWVYLSSESGNIRTFTSCTRELPKSRSVVGTKIRVAV